MPHRHVPLPDPKSSKMIKNSSGEESEQLKKLKETMRVHVRHLSQDSTLDLF